MIDKEVDIAGTLKIIEQLKCQMLMDIAHLFSDLNEPSGSTNIERGDIMADMIIITYLLSKKLGIPYQQLNRRIVNKIRLGLIESNSSDRWRQELSELLKYFEPLE